MIDYSLRIECVDESDQDALYKRITYILEQIDVGDYSGREVKKVMEK